jgi:hypothetical protein
VIAALPLTGNTASPQVAALLNAVGVLRELNAAGRMIVPEQATTPAATVFVPTRWRGYRDIGRLQLYRLGPAAAWRSRYPHAGPLRGQPIQTQLIADHWNDLLRLVGSMKFGHTTASLLIAKLHASSRQSTLAKALHEYGRLVRTIYLCRYLADEELRRRVRRQLNKGESLHALRRDLFFAHQRHVRRRHLDDQIDQALWPDPGHQRCGAVDHHLPRRCAGRASRRRVPGQR